MLIVKSSVWGQPDDITGPLDDKVNESRQQESTSSRASSRRPSDYEALNYRLILSERQYCLQKRIVELVKPTYMTRNLLFYTACRDNCS